MGLSLRPGEIFADDFRVIRPLSKGGMGEIYVVEQLRTGKRRALKLMLPGTGADESARRRFEQEARIGALIASEHVVDVIAAGFDPRSETPWLVMELLEGEDLARYIERHGALAPADVHEIFRQLCHALAAAHDIPVVHRDLKPENIFLAKARLADERFLVKVLDFGIAKLLTEAVKTTGNIGTPIWMAPEQADLNGQVTPAADVWSLGLIAFELLAGVPYWRCASQERIALGAVLKEVLVDPIEPASERARALGGAALPPGFDAWFSRCVVRAPEDRHPSAREAWTALAPVLGGRASERNELPSVRVSTADRSGALSAFETTVEHVPAGAATITQDGAVLAVAGPRRERARIAVLAGVGIGLVAAVAVAARVAATTREGETASAVSAAPPPAPASATATAPPSSVAAGGGPMVAPASAASPSSSARESQAAPIARTTSAPPATSSRRTTPTVPTSPPPVTPRPSPPRPAATKPPDFL